jgi:hypothetical protein
MKTVALALLVVLLPLLDLAQQREHAADCPEIPAPERV